MALLSILSANNATLLTRINSNPRSFLSSEKINSLARKHRILFRTRKTDYSILVGSSLELASSHNKSISSPLRACDKGISKTQVYI